MKKFVFIIILAFGALNVSAQSLTEVEKVVVPDLNTVVWPANEKVVLAYSKTNNLSLSDIKEFYKMFRSAYAADEFVVAPCLDGNGIPYYEMAFQTDKGLEALQIVAFSFRSWNMKLGKHKVSLQGLLLTIESGDTLEYQSWPVDGGYEIIPHQSKKL